MEEFFFLFPNTLTNIPEGEKKSSFPYMHRSRSVTNKTGDGSELGKWLDFGLCERLMEIVDHVLKPPIIDWIILIDPKPFFGKERHPFFYTLLWLSLIHI
eukprot:TRINITY_DN14474_c0_g1_i1.p1 TRINITY_DN14474_c0_g1~~TRINITY_DN14474_c0_g1_i1.p1  ORF type:complete len:100 (-),score=7.40 TRINITY_DN14474_c0_g1_i1:23-322(-)